MSSPTTGIAGVESSNRDCSVNIPDYSVLRQKNLEKINGYYSTLLDTYTSTYAYFNTQLSSVSVNDRSNANTKLKPKVENINSQMINLNQEMIDSVNRDTDLILDQKNQLQERTKSIDTLISDITLLKDKDNEMSVLKGARTDSLNSTTEGAESMQFTTYIYIGINILLVILVLGLVIYIVYSNWGSNLSKNSNNAHKSIMKNNNLQ
jgi:hypothetical protein